MWVFYIQDEGLPIEMQTGENPHGDRYEKVGNMQSAFKILVKNKDVANCKVHDIEIYPLGVTKAKFDRKGPGFPKPLKPSDDLPFGSTRENAIFVHVPRAKQQLTPEQRRIYSSPKPTKPKLKMARPEIEKLIISPKKVVRTQPRKMVEVTVQCLNDGTEFKKLIDPKNTVSQLKDLFAEPSGVPADNQNLYLKGNQLLDDSKTATEVGIQHGSIIALEPKSIRVTVRTPEGKNIPITMKQSDTILFIKQKVAPESGVEVSKQLLKYHGNILSDDAKTARETGLEDGAIIDLLPNPITVIVKTETGKTIPVTMKLTDKVQFIKETVAPEAGIEVAKQILKFQGKTLPDKESAKDVGLKEGSVVDLSVVKPKKEKKKEKEEDDWDLPDRKKQNYNIDFNPTPFDLTRFRAWFIVGDQVPFEMICPIAMTVREFKAEILLIRNDARFVEKYLRGLDDANELKIYPAGSWGEGEPLEADIPVPKNSSEYAFFSVLR